jgi:hypothetical protein
MYPNRYYHFWERVYLFRCWLHQAHHYPFAFVQHLRHPGTQICSVMLALVQALPHCRNKQEMRTQSNFSKTRGSLTC